MSPRPRAASSLLRRQECLGRQGRLERSKLPLDKPARAGPASTPPQQVHASKNDRPACLPAVLFNIETLQAALQARRYGLLAAAQGQVQHASGICQCQQPAV